MNKYAVYIEVVGDNSSKKLKVETTADTQTEAIQVVLDNILVLACKPIGEEKHTEREEPKYGIDSLPPEFKKIFKL